MLYYKTADDTSLPLKKVDTIINCVQLQWERTPREKNILSASKEYGMILLKGIRAVVKIVSKSGILTSTDRNDTKSIRADNSSHGNKN